jgi:hypothetical protein
MRGGMQPPSARDVHEKLRQALVRGANADGGWPYYGLKASRLEPTCWALLALSAAGGPADHQYVARGRAYMRALQRPDGLLAEAAAPGPNYAWNGLALLTDVTIHGAPMDAWQERLVSGLLAARGIALPEGPSPVRQNNQLRAWSWTDDTFSWIEPTACCLLALKRARAGDPLARTRIADGEAVVLDRACDGGGWNYGNARVLGQDLRPYVPTTALALLAMQDRRSHPVIQRGMSWLDAHAMTEPAAMALSWVAVYRQVFQTPSPAVQARLIQQEAATNFLGNLHLTAMALYALTVPTRGAGAFALP